MENFVKNFEQLRNYSTGKIHQEIHKILKQGREYGTHIVPTNAIDNQYQWMKVERLVMQVLDNLGIEHYQDTTPLFIGYLYQNFIVRNQHIYDVLKDDENNVLWIRAGKEIDNEEKITY